MTEILGFLRSRMFEIVTILGALTLCFKQPKRKNGWIWFALAVAADLAFNVLWADWMRSHPPIQSPTRTEMTPRMKSVP